MLNRLAQGHSKSQQVNIQQVAKGAGEMRAQIRRAYDKDAKRRQLEERIVLIGHQLEQSKTLVKLFKEKIEYLTDVWPVLQGTLTHDKEAPVWAFNTLSNAYFELVMETNRINELTDSLRDTSNDVLHLEMDVCELHDDMSNIAKVYSDTPAWQAFPYEACAECLERTAYCKL